MPATRKLEIDLDEKFTHLPHAPIVEAVIDVQALAQVPWEQEAVGNLIAPQLRGYPKIVSRDKIQEEFTLGQTDSKRVVRDLGWYGLQFQSADEKNAGRFTREGFFFGRLSPYQTWETFFGEAMALWKIYTQTAKPLDIGRIGLRFINRIEMQPGEVNCEDYILMHPHHIEGLDLPFVGFLNRDTLAVPGHPLAVNITRALQPAISAEAGHALILDIDVFTTASIETDDEQLALLLRQMRWLKNKIFFGNITDKARRRFD
jgi:uncharacterized protein (TIGR04255 family)